MSLVVERARRTKSAPVGVVGKVLQILERLDQAQGGLLLREVVDLTGIHKSTAYRFLSHLANEGYVFRDGDGYYMVGPKLSKLGTGVTYQATLCRTSADILKKLSTTTGETVNLAVLDGHEILYLSVFESSHTFRMVSQVGTRRPIYCTALGKVILAHLPAEQQRKITAATKYERFTENTLASAEDLRKDLVKIHRRGYAIDEEEAVAGARCVAAPVLDKERKLIAAVSVSGPTVRLTRAQVPVIAEHLRNATTQIASKLQALSL